jgi:hypothetical protein
MSIKHFSHERSGTSQRKNAALTATAPYTFGLALQTFFSTFEGLPNGE